MNAPTIPMMRSPTIPNPVPCTICPASHPAMRPTPNMIRRLSFDMCIFVSSRRRCHVVESLMRVRRVSQLKSCGDDDFAPRLHGADSDSVNLGSNPGPPATDLPDMTVYFQFPRSPE